MTDRTIIRGKIRSKEIRPGYKTTGGIVVHPMDATDFDDHYSQAKEVAALLTQPTEEE